MLRSNALYHLLVAVAVLVALAGHSPADIINPSFETGDFTGWTTQGDCTVQTGGASHGNHWALLSAQADFFDANGDESILTQTFTLPLGVPYYQADLLYTAPGGSSDLSATMALSGNPGSAISFYSGTETALPSGWKRYTIDASGFAGQPVEVRFRIWAGPGVLATQRVDNLGPIPEPSTLALVVIGGVAFILRKVRR